MNLVNSQVGKVWLVGAGPGDPGLFTMKGSKVLSEAEVVVYDALVGQSILNMIPAGAELINVGKRSSHHLMRQEKISELLVDKAKEGKRVVRLKGGDPFLFGRGGEELELLVKNNIPYEVVPGVTSALSVPAYQGIPVTHRDYCSSLHIITGHKRAESDDSLGIDFEALVRTKGTLVFLMGVSALGDICRGLLDAGMPADMPAALLIKGTTAAQDRIVATVATLEEEVFKQGAKTPAIIVVGKVCALADEFSWVDKLPLGGKKVLVTRPKERIGETASKLRALGAEVLELPSIKTVAVDGNTALKEALASIQTTDWVVFTSPIGVRIFFDELADLDLDYRALANVKFAVIGTGTAKELKQRGFHADLMPEVFDAEHLGVKLYDACTEGEKILIPRARIGSKELTDALSGNVAIEKDSMGDDSIGNAAEGNVDEGNAVIGNAAAGKSATGKKTKNLQVIDLPTYDTEFETSELIDVKKEFEQGTVDYVVFTSASTVRGFEASTSGIDYTKVKAICIGKQTEAAAKALGMQTRVAEKATIDSLLECLVQAVAEEE